MTIRAPARLPIADHLLGEIGLQMALAVATKWTPVKQPNRELLMARQVAAFRIVQEKESTWI